MSLLEGRLNFHTLAATGNVVGVETVHKFGAVNGLANNTLADMWWPATGGGQLHKNWATAASTIKISSTDAADSAAGLGVRKIQLIGLDTALDPISELIDTAGLGDATSVNSYLRVNIFLPVEVGEYETGAGSSNKGVITARRTSDNEIEKQIGINPDIAGGAFPNSIDYSSHFSVPAGFEFILGGIIFNADAMRPVNMISCSRKIPDTFVAPFPPLLHPTLTTQITGNAPQDETDLPIVIDEKTDFWFMMDTGTAGSSSAQVEYMGLVLKIE